MHIYGENMQQLFRKTKQLGFTMVELLLVATIIITIGTFIISRTAQKENDQKIIKLISGHRELVDTMHSIGANLPNYFIDWYGALDISNQSSRLPPSIYYVAPSGGTPPLRSIFGGFVTINAFEIYGPSNGDTFPGIPSFNINYNSLSDSACLRLVNSVGPESFDTYINGTRVRLTPPALLTSVDLGQVSTLCAGNNNLVQFDSKRPMPKGLLPSDSSTTSSFQTILMTKYRQLDAAKIAMHP